MLVHFADFACLHEFLLQGTVWAIQPRRFSGSWANESTRMSASRCRSSSKFLQSEVPVSFCIANTLTSNMHLSRTSLRIPREVKGALEGMTDVESVDLKRLRLLWRTACSHEGFFMITVTRMTAMKVTTLTTSRERTRKTMVRFLRRRNSFFVRIGFLLPVSVWLVWSGRFESSTIPVTEFIGSGRATGTLRTNKLKEPTRKLISPREKNWPTSFRSTSSYSLKKCTIPDEGKDKDREMNFCINALMWT